MPSKTEHKRVLSRNQRSIFLEKFKIRDDICPVAMEMGFFLLLCCWTGYHCSLTFYSGQISGLSIFSPQPPPFNKKHILFSQDIHTPPKKKRKKERDLSRTAESLPTYNLLNIQSRKQPELRERKKKEECFNSKVKPQLMTSGDRSQVDKQSITVLNIWDLASPPQ